MTTNQLTSTNPAALVRHNFEIGRRDGMSGLRPSWHDDAVWHITGTNAFAGSFPVDDYFPLVEAALADPGYRWEVVGLRQLGELVFVDIASEGTIGDLELDGAGGVMIYRVVDGLITEGWAIPAGSGGTLPF